VSEQVLDEVRDVLNRPEIVRKFPHLTPTRAALFLDRVERQAARGSDVPVVFHHERDPKDERYVNLALAAAARFLVTWDRHLLDLMDERHADSQAFRASYPHLRIVSPVGLLHELTSQRSQGRSRRADARSEP
jgi:putative PIN family toxin of toxin-antitoxin system